MRINIPLPEGDLSYDGLNIKVGDSHWQVVGFHYSKFPEQEVYRATGFKMISEVSNKAGITLTHSQGRVVIGLNPRVVLECDGTYWTVRDFYE